MGEKGELGNNKIDAIIWRATPWNLGCAIIYANSGGTRWEWCSDMASRRVGLWCLQCAMHRNAAMHDAKPLEVFTELHGCVVAR